MKKHKNSLKVNSNWTAVKAVKGWKHYRISARKYTDKELYLELMAVCDRDIRFDVKAVDFSTDDNWVSGWK